MMILHSKCRLRAWGRTMLALLGGGVSEGRDQVEPPQLRTKLMRVFAGYTETYARASLLCTWCVRYKYTSIYTGTYCCPGVADYYGSNGARPGNTPVFSLSIDDEEPPSTGNLCQYSLVSNIQRQATGYGYGHECAACTWYQRYYSSTRVKYCCFCARCGRLRTRDRTMLAPLGTYTRRNGLPQENYASIRWYQMPDNNWNK